MKQLVYFIAVGLFFTVLQVATVEAQGPACDPNPACDPSDPAGNCCPTCDPNPACVMSDTNAKPCCAADPCSGMTGAALTTCRDTHRDQHEDHGEDCAAKETPALVAACWERNRPAPGTVPMCGDAPCPPPNAP